MRRITALGLIALALGVSMVPSSAAAAPIGDKQRQARQLEAEINANAEQLAVLNEAINGVQLRLADATAAVADADDCIASALDETQRLAALVRGRAAAVYRGASSGAQTSTFDVNTSEMSSRDKYADAASERDNSLFRDLAVARA